jgi:hypothetical protein
MVRPNPIANAPLAVDERWNNHGHDQFVMTALASAA